MSAPLNAIHVWINGKQLGSAPRLGRNVKRSIILGAVWRNSVSCVPERNRAF